MEKTRCGIFIVMTVAEGRNENAREEGKIGAKGKRQEKKREIQK